MSEGFTNEDLITLLQENAPLCKYPIELRQFLTLSWDNVVTGVEMYRVMGQTDSDIEKINLELCGNCKKSKRQDCPENSKNNDFGIINLKGPPPPLPAPRHICKECMRDMSQIYSGPTQMIWICWECRRVSITDEKCKPITSWSENGPTQKKLDIFSDH